MTDAEKVLAELRQGPRTASQLYGLHLIAHSRISDLRRRGHVIRCQRVKGEGARGYLYTLLFDAETPLSAVASSQTPKSDGGEAPALSGEQLALV